MRTIKGKQMKIIITVVLSILLFSGCQETPTVYNNSEYRGEAMKVADGIYFKKVHIQGMYALLQCDKDGNITHNQNINTGYQQGKVFVNTSVLTPTMSEDKVSNVGTFTFKCTDINDCYNQVSTVKTSMGR